MNVLKNIYRKVKCAMRNVNCAHSVLHAFYFAFVAWEAAHWYGLVAGGLFVATLIELGSSADG